ncbi:MAG: protease complex subunit PrcB family protein [bacterium]|nr:protease complex subunit PrcB family protein [bacterium]
MRDMPPIVAFVLLAACIGVVVYATGNVPGGGAPPGGAPGAPVSFSILASGAHSSVAARKNYLITSENQLRELWKLVDVGGSPPTVDFSIYQVLAVFTGTEPSAGYAIAITKVADGKERMVSVQITAPGVSCLAATTLTAPYEIVRLTATTLAYTHEDTATTTSCLR